MAYRKNEPLRVVGVTTEGKKVYDGDTFPNYPNRKSRRYFLKHRNRNTNNAKQTRGRAVQLKTVFVQLASNFRWVYSRVKGIINHGNSHLK